MSKALPIAAAIILGGIALTPVFVASANPSKAHHSNFDPKKASPTAVISYTLGYEVANQAPKELDINAFTAGARDGYNKEGFPFSEDDINKAYNEFIATQQKNPNTALQQQAQATGQQMADLAKQNAEAGAKFLAENAKQPGVKTTASGLQYIVKTAGSGKQPKPTDTVSVEYTGKLINGQIFDQSDSGHPVSLPLNGVIPGWTEGLQLMKEGGEYTFFIPANLAYGEQGAGNRIPPNSTLIFDVKLVKVQ